MKFRQKEWNALHQDISANKINIMDLVSEIGTELDLTDVSISLPQMETLRLILSNVSSLKSLILKQVCVGGTEKYVSGHGDGQSESTRVTFDNTLKARLMEVLESSATNLTSLETLSLSSNELGRIEAKALTRFLPKLPFLKDLNIGSNLFFAYVSDIVKNLPSSITSLGLRNNDINDGIIITITPMLSQLPLTTLDLAGNNSISCGAEKCLNEFLSSSLMMAPRNLEDCKRSYGPIGLWLLGDNHNSFVPNKVKLCELFGISSTAYNPKIATLGSVISYLRSMEDDERSAYLEKEIHPLIEAENFDILHDLDISIVKSKISNDAIAEAQEPIAAADIQDAPTQVVDASKIFDDADHDIA